MYLSKLHLTNWRSYSDANFEFKRPTERRPIVLIGAMNGHGKTSFLISLYLGLFGSFGLRHCEGFRMIGENDINSYRKAIAKFRRSTADPDEPTIVDLTFTPTLNDRDEQEVRIIRRWYFTSSNTPRPGEGFEELEIHVGDRILRRTEPILANERIEKELFPAHVCPAFFFDGEQAQALIEGAGEEGIRKAVNTMFGASVLAELQLQIRNYLARSHGALGGKQKTSEKQDILNQKVALQKDLNKRIGRREGDLEELNKQRDDIDRTRNQLRDDLVRAGGGSADAERVNKAFKEAESNKNAAEAAVTELANQMGLVLAVSRLDPTIRRRLRREQLREDYENLRQGTLDKRERVLAEAMPEPPERDQLLGNISSETRAKVKQRILTALQAIYEPPDPDTAEGFLLGHVRGQQRGRLLNRLNETKSFAFDHVRDVAKKLRDAREAYEDIKARHTRLGNQSEDTKNLTERIKRFDEQMDEVIRRISTAENEIKKWKADCHEVSAEVGRLREELARLEPEQRRIAVADRVSRVVEALTEQLKPVTTQRLEEHVTKHFLAIADQRFKGGRIAFTQDGEPHLHFEGQSPKALLSSMSGFERRSFGIAFSLALAEITRRRVPLVIDTPLGNADSLYRPRTLDALRKFDCDQVIILTHDREVTPDLLEHIQDHVCQKFLVEFVESEKKSIVYPNRFFFEKP